MMKKIKVGDYTIEESINFGTAILNHPDFVDLGVFVVVYEDGSIEAFRYYSRQELIDASFDEYAFAVMINGYPWMAMKERRGKSYKKFKRAVRIAAKVAKNNNYI